MPFIDTMRYLIDLREQVVSFPPQPVITEDNLVVSIDTVIYFQVTDPVAATYEIANYIQAIEQLTMTTLRNIVGGMDLEETLTSRDSINSGLRGVLDEATGKWGIRVNRVELKGIDPPPSIKDSMEKQMRADREKRAVILTAEGQRQAAILTAEGSKQSQILNAEGDRESQILRAQADREASILRAQGEGQAIQTVFQAIHDGQPDQSLLAYQYLQMMPKIAEGNANKVWVIPSEITKAMEGLGSSIHEIAGIPTDATPRTRVDMGPSEPQLPRTVRRRRAERHQQGRRGGHRRGGVGGPSDVADGTARGRRRRTTPRSRVGPRRSESDRESVLVALAGVAAGTINTVVGSGTLITFPTLLAFGVPPVTANVSNTVGLVPGSMSGVVGYRRELAGQRGRVLRLGAASLRRRHRRRAAPARAAVGGLRRHRAGADRARRAARDPRSPHPARGGRARRGPRRHPRPRRVVGLARRRRGRCLRRLLRRRAGRAADGDPRHRRRRLDAAPHRHQERARAHRQRRRGRRLHRGRRQSTGGSPA